MLKKKNVWRGCAFLFTFIFALGIIAGTALESSRNLVDGFLGTKSQKMVTETADGELYTTFTSEYKNTDELVAAHKEMGEKSEEEGAVLLKNNGGLPIAGTSKVTLLGLKSDASASYYGATTGVNVPEDQNVSLKDALVAKGFQVNQTMVDVYSTLAADKRFASTGGAKGQVMPNSISMSFSGVMKGKEVAYIPAEPTVEDITKTNSGAMDSLKEYSDAAIVVVGRPGSEAGDFYAGETGVASSTGARNPLALTNDERNIINFATEHFEKVVVLINSSNAMEIEELKQNSKVDSVLWIGFPGNYGFLGVADILNGNANPSGHLTDTFATNTTSTPAMANTGVYAFSNAKEYLDNTKDRGDNYLVQAEGIYVGYRYYETRYADCVMKQGNASSTTGVFDSKGNWNYGQEVSYAFGYGQSYTTFSQKLENIKVSDNVKNVTATITVTNTGDVAGKDVVQLYASAPYYKGGVEKSAIQLLDFGKTKELKPGESQTIEIVADLQNLASYDDDNAKTYILDKGNYYFTVGNGSHEAMNNVLSKQGYSKKDGMDQDGNAENVLDWNYTPEGDTDNYTFAVSNNQTKVTNQLEEADLNTWLPGTVTYLSRSDWSGTWPKTYDDIAITPEMAEQLKNNTYTIQTGDDTSGIVFDDKSSNLTFSDMKGADYDDPRWDELLNKLNLQEAINFITCGNRSIKSMESIGFVGGIYTENSPNGFNAKLAANSNEESPWYVSEDDANASYSTNDLGSAPLLAASFNKEFAYEYGVLWGNDSLFNNIPILWGPGLNLHRTAYNGRNCEYYSEDPVVAGVMGTNLIQGGLTKGLIMAPKHFAFNDQESNRNGIAPFMEEQKARELELRSFQISVKGGTLGFMTSFSRIGCTYVGAEDALLNNILRNEWGFNGYVVSDMVNPGSYMTWKESVIAGTTSFDAREVNDAWKDYITESTNTFSKDATMLKAIKERVHQDLYVYAQSNITNAMNSSSHLVQVNVWWRLLYKSVIGVSGVLFVISAALYIVASLKKKNNKEVK